jgi:hypothetical protein
MARNPQWGWYEMIRQNLRSLMDQVILTGQQVTSGVRSARISKDDHKTYNAFILSRCLTTFDAVELLCEAGYGADAFALARGMFEDALRLRYINKSPESRLALFHLRGLQHEMRAIKELNRIFGPREVAQFLPPSHAADVKFAQAELQAILGKGQEAVPSPLTMAIDVGLEGMYMPFYFAASDYTHSGVMSYRSYVKDVGPNVTEFRVGQDHDDHRIPSAIYTCCISCSIVFIEVMGAFGILLDAARASNALRAMNDRFREYTLGRYRNKTGNPSPPTSLAEQEGGLSLGAGCD